ncbi:MAG: ATP-binding protein [Alphaproteobacteria bacterium]
MSLKTLLRPVFARLHLPWPALPAYLRRGIKRVLPHTLFGRALMIIVTPLILLQIVSAFVFYDRHWNTITRRLATALVGDINLVLEEMQRDPGAENRIHVFNQARRHLQLEIVFMPDRILPNVASNDYSGSLARTLARALREGNGKPFVIDTDSSRTQVSIDIQLADGVLTVSAPRERLFSTTTYVFILWMIGTSLLLFAVASIFMRNQIRPIRRLAHAADRFGKGRDIDADFKLEGATEVRRASMAFNLMRDRIRRQIRQRTDMLSGVSHDLRTPLTRMKLQLAMLGDGPEVADLQSDVAEMERMIEGYLTFARGEGDEPAQPTNLTGLVEDAAQTWRRNGVAVDCHVEAQIVLNLKADAVRRCIDNLISNAARYGTHVWVRLALRDETVEVAVEDDGPGIPEAERENVFRAFFRLDHSRSQETGGSGLGLAIARDVARHHGGDILLEDSPHGGLRARLRLPI